ncbi:MAG TPA: hypothetical protein VKH37_04715, partial [Ferruginibacter sp.]|nr:hypothetical protein [Ferruginibacter sp.]
MNWNAIFGIVSITAFLLPVVVILYYKFYKHRSLAALMANYMIMALYNMMEQNFIPVSTVFRSNFGILANYLDTPLMMMALLFFCPNKQKQQKVYFLAILFIA